MQMRGLIICAAIALAGVIPARATAQSCDNDTIPLAQVEQVYPTATLLPENLLRFYIYFSEPMAREGIWKSVVLLNASGDVVPGAFIENKFDLWSPDDRRLTVLFDPGRVKTGLVAHNDLGRALEAGKSYTLQIRASAETRRGCALGDAFNLRFDVNTADFEAPNLSNWQIQVPAAGSRHPLHVVMDGPLDHLSMAYRIRVHDSNKNPVRGSLSLGENEQSWVFTPQQNWAATPHQPVVDTTLEDIAGNRLTGLFDRPVVTDGLSEPGSEVETLSFTPRNN